MIYSTTYEEKELQKEGKQLILSVFPLVFMVFGILYGLVNHEIFSEGLMAILYSPTTLLTDFLKVGGVGPAFVNAAFVGIFNIYLLRRFEMRINGLLIAAIFTVIGFSFFGKNILNIMPIYLGGYLYARRQGIAMKNIILIIMFSTALAPIVSEITFGGYFEDRKSVV